MKGSVIEYRGKRGLVFRAKFTDASGRQVMETLGAERDGWTRKKAEEALADLVSDVRRRGYRKPRALKFSEVAEQWQAKTSVENGWKPSTAAQYVSIVRRLNEHFGAMPVAAIRPRHVSGFKAEALESQGAASVSRDMSILHSIMQFAVVKSTSSATPRTGSSTRRSSSARASS